MTGPVTVEPGERATTITMDDGKANVFSPAMLEALHDALDRAEQLGTVVLLRGRPGYFSAGFDLGVIRDRPDDVMPMLRLGALLARRILAFPAPVVVACTGHAYPAGAFLLMAADVRVGAEGPFSLGLNEVRIGLALPEFAVVLARARLTPAAFDRTAVTGLMFDPPGALSAGLLDAVVAPDALDDAALAAATDLAAVHRRAHLATKLRVRAPVLEALDRAIADELA
jgi:enoyl-CoA hydratase